ncbi:endonuclease-reverse transcriptase [Plakobranchus ocellatus]|uniref:Endonuclease-reverse transcriptase n=1 Tax=Plakobranchus ocellatus TaxID=259542 RepID=A0AAV3Z1A4_9GAST|nr:endonuclease-reverse transcriptase [Plakobranchus ocellatus]
MTKYVEKTNIYSERKIACTIKTRGGQLKIIQVYVPTKIYDDEDVEIFYEELGKAMGADKSKYYTVMGDFNAKIGKKDKHSGIQNQPTTLTSSPDKEEIPPFLEEEVKEMLDEMRKKKAPGKDGITSDVMRIGGHKFIDFEKALDSVEHAAIVQALRKVNINENYVTMIENIYNRFTARIHINNQISEAFEIQRGVRQGDPISPKLFTTVIEQVFEEADLQYGINTDGEYLRDLRFADDVALCKEREQGMEEHLERLNCESKKSD